MRLPVVECPHIKERSRYYNVCGLGLYGGRPSYGVCAQCSHSENEPGSFFGKSPLMDMVRPKPKPEQERYDLKLPGDWLAYMIKRMTGFSEDSAMIPDDNTCGCRAFRRKMNGWGWMGCLKHRREITVHMTSQAKRYGLIMEEDGLIKAFYRAMLGKPQIKDSHNASGND